MKDRFQVTLDGKIIDMNEMKAEKDAAKFIDTVAELQALKATVEKSSLVGYKEYYFNGQVKVLARNEKDYNDYCDYMAKGANQ